MAPVLVLWWSWRKRHGAMRHPVDRWCELAIVASYLVQLVGLAVGLVAVWQAAAQLDHILDFAALVGIIVAAEYVGHAAAAVLSVRVVRRSGSVHSKGVPCR